MKLILASVFLAFGLAGSIQAAQIENITFADKIKSGDFELILHNVGLMRYKKVLRGYVAALYLGLGVRAEQLFDDVPKRLELEYFWSIKGHAFAKAGDEALTQNVSAETFQKIKPRLAKLNALYQDVKAGDRYALTYLPGQGLELAHNGQRLGVIEGADFAAAYLSIWLGKHPLSESLKQQLLR